MLHKIKCFRYVHLTAEDISTVLHEVAGGLDDSPRTHVGGDNWLFGKLEIINTQLGSEENKNHPIQ